MCIGKPKILETHLLQYFALVRWSGIKHALSLSYACISAWQSFNINISPIQLLNSTTSTNIWKDMWVGRLGGGNEDNGNILQKVHAHNVPWTLQQATANLRLHWRLLDTHSLWVMCLAAYATPRIAAPRAPAPVGHGREVWQNVAHWRRQWQTT